MMTKVPDIVKIMRVEEHFRQFQQKASKISQEDSSADESCNAELGETICFMDDEDVSSQGDTSLDDSQLLGEEPNETYEQLKRKYIKVTEELKESKQKFDALAEYFETLTEKTITYGKRDLFSDVSDIIFQITSTGRITYINSAIEKIAGYKSEGMIGSNIDILFPAKDWKTIQKTFFSRFNKTATMERELTNFETTLLCKDGHTIPIEINGKPLDRTIEVIGKKPQLRIQGSIRDITERIRAEEERRKHAEHLRVINEELTTTNQELKRTQDELQLLNEDLEKKVQERTAEIELLLRRKDEFIIQLGHDLKSPLTPLIGLLPMVLEKEQDSNLKELLQVINRNIRYIRDLVVKTLQLERLNSPTTMLNIDTVNLLELTNDVIQNKRISFEEKYITVDAKIDETLFLQADSVQLKELFDNLLTNAIKFTPNSGHIVIGAKKEKDATKISITDSGVGMTSEQIDRIFETFYKVDPARHDLESSGLGLSICKRIAEKHGGKIWAESDGLGKGTTFYFTIPRMLINSEKSN
ncbi:MAG: PAS domain S-box protein [Candidatus Thermoplasmatota archaeon]|nr:PAS domain S-box protein [Candidatus Thermoplasmatota archaeon]